MITTKGVARSSHAPHTRLRGKGSRVLTNRLDLLSVGSTGHLWPEEGLRATFGAGARIPCTCMAFVARGMDVLGIGVDLPHTQVLDNQVGSDHAHASDLYTTSCDQEKRSRISIHWRQADRQEAHTGSMASSERLLVGDLQAGAGGTNGSHWNSQSGDPPIRRRSQ